MPTKAKTLDNMSKHLTRSEIEARQSAEAGVMPTRFPRKPPAFIKAKTPERKIWDRVLADMKDYEILDCLDSDVLGLYCSKMVRWVEAQAAYTRLRKAADGGDELSKADLKLLVSISSEMQALEVGILAYATKLGLTPDGRARLARKLAEQEEDDPDADLFG